MELRHLFILSIFFLSIFFALFFGIFCTFLPRLVFWVYGLAPEDAAIWVSRLVGGSILGFATLTWLGTRTASVEATRAIALALLLQDTIGCPASMAFQRTRKVNIVGWWSLAPCGVALAYAFFLFVQPDAV